MGKQLARVKAPEGADADGTGQLPALGEVLDGLDAGMQERGDLVGRADRPAQAVEDNALKLVGIDGDAEPVIDQGGIERPQLVAEPSRAGDSAVSGELLDVPGGP